MKTSYFAKSANISGAISISRYPPEWYHGLCYTKLAPPSSIIKVKDFEEYKHLYYKFVLSRLDKLEVYNELVELAYPNEPVLLCFEKDNRTCHRSIVAEWLSEVSVNSIKELGVCQMTLF